MLYNFITFVWWEFLSVHGTLSGRREYILNMVLNCWLIALMFFVLLKLALFLVLSLQIYTDLIFLMDSLHLQVKYLSQVIYLPQPCYYSVTRVASIGCMRHSQLLVVEFC
jgi:hypothetical protein